MSHISGQCRAAEFMRLWKEVNSTRIAPEIKNQVKYFIAIQPVHNTILFSCRQILSHPSSIVCHLSSFKASLCMRFHMCTIRTRPADSIQLAMASDFSKLLGSMSQQGRWKLGERVQLHNSAWIGFGSHLGDTLRLSAEGLETKEGEDNHKCANSYSCRNRWDRTSLNISESSATCSESTEDEGWSFNSLN